MTVKYSQARLRDLGIEGGCDFPARLACAAINFEGSFSNVLNALLISKDRYPLSVKMHLPTVFPVNGLRSRSAA
jgi:hypothetical protein